MSHFWGLGSHPEEEQKGTSQTGTSAGQIGLGIFQTLGQTVVALRAIEEGVAIGGSPGLPAGAVLSGSSDPRGKLTAQLSKGELLIAGLLLVGGVIVLAKVF